MTKRKLVDNQMNPKRCQIAAEWLVERVDEMEIDREDLDEQSPGLWEALQALLDELNSRASNKTP